MTTTPVDVRYAIPIPTDRLAAFCRKWRVSRLELFGSVLRPDEFRPESDVDVMVMFDPDASPTAYTLLDMRDELADLFARPVDLVPRLAVEQGQRPGTRQAILETARVIYAG